jgi:hypothetical protein
MATMANSDFLDLSKLLFLRVQDGEMPLHAAE